MTTWKIIGADGDTGADVEIEVVAADEASALLAGLQRGVYVAQIRRAPVPAASGPARPPAPGPRPAAASPNGAVPVETRPGAARPKTPRPSAAKPAGDNVARARAPIPDAATSPAQRPAPNAAPTPAPPTARPVAPNPPAAAAPRRVQVRRAPADLLPRAFADLLSAPQPPAPPRRRPMR